MTERSRRSFLRTAAVGGALTGGAVLLPGGLARAAAVPAAPRTGASPDAVTLQVTNDSSAFEQFAVYQNDPDLGVYNVMSLAWFVKGAHPQQTVQFQWQQDYSFLLFGKGGSTITQSVNADPSDLNQNQIALTYTNGAYALVPGRALGTAELGSLYVDELVTVPVDGVGKVGIGMSGAALYAVQTEPNQELVFTPHPTQHFWLTAGNFTPGENLDIEEISTAVALDFVPGTPGLAVTLNRDSTWSTSLLPTS
ncbi:hypothetical protein [Actinospica robiniae]|uniref:hypothetical protein n=1 Tax=Actinospica robiniae TaxID=304901 RepID=UPI0004067D31|nr:hypothetical protein [Actinospica robiniae]